VRTTEPGNLVDMAFAFSNGATGSAVLPMKRRGKLVLPPTWPVKRSTGRIFHPLQWM
jgi:hypothetical protein